MKKIIVVFLGIVFLASISSCKSTRRKNRCNTCPTWDQVDLSQESNG